MSDKKMSEVFEFGVCLEVRGGHISNRYGEFNESQADVIEDVIGGHDRLTEENKQLRNALSDLVDGESSYDLVHTTGLSLDRCQEIIDLALKK